jgi:hypothetical protein
MRSWTALTLVVLLGCEPVVEEQLVEYVARDEQVDGSGEAVVAAPKLCVSGSNVYAVWHDNRRGGRNQVFFDVGRAGGSAWSESDTQLSTDPTNDTVAEHPALACAGDSVYVLWEDDRDSEVGDKNIYFRSSDDAGRTWGEEVMVTVDPEGDYDAIRPEIAVDWAAGGSGDKSLLMVWADNRYGAYDIFATRSTNGTTFLDEPVRLDGDEPGAAYSGRPRLESDGAGGVYVAWEDSRSGSNDVWVSRSRDRGYNWSETPTRLTGAAGLDSDAFGVSLSVDRESEIPAIYAAWHDDRNGRKDIFVNYSVNAGDTWLDEPTRIDADGPGASESFHPSVAASNGEVLVTWHDDREIGFDIFARNSENAGASWGGEYRLDTDIAGSAHSTRPTAVRNGDVVAVVWSDLRRGPDAGADLWPDLWYRTSVDGGVRWSESDGRIDDDPQSTAISEEAQVVLAGPTVHVLWIDYRLGNADLWYRGMPASGPPEE